MQAQHCEENPDLQGTRCGHLEHACKLIADGQTDIRQASTDLQKQVKVRFVVRWPLQEPGRT